MAKKNTTPESVLNAPKSEPIVVVEHKGLSRAQRRRLSKRLTGSNKPYRNTGQGA